MKTAWNQVQTYRTDIPAVFRPNAVTVISDGTSAAMSSFSGGFEHYAPWRTIDGRDVISNKPALEVLLKGVFEPTRFLDLVQNFVLFSDEHSAHSGDRIKTISRSNLVQSRKFSEQLEEAINKYTNRSLTTAEIIAELVKLAKETHDQANRHEQLGLTEAESAFYDAIVQNESAVLDSATRSS